MNIGVPKEVLIEEKRVGLVPHAVDFLVRRGHRVFVETGAGAGACCSDDEFTNAGATIVYNHKEAFMRADLVLKVMPPTREEAEFFHEGQVLLSSLELGMRSKGALQALIQSGVTAMGYEILEDEHGELPVLLPMSEITGRLLPVLAANLMMIQNGGPGIVLGGVPGLKAARVVIIGAGVVGVTAARTFDALGARVVLMDRDMRRLRNAKSRVGAGLCVQLAVPYKVIREIAQADVVIGAVLARGNVSPVVITDDMLRSMRPNGLVMDVSIDQGGCVEGIRPTSTRDPVYREHNINFFAVPNIPSMVPRAASVALSNVVLSFVQLMDDLGSLGPDRVLARYPVLGKGVYAHKGKCTHPRIAELAGRDYAGPCCSIEEVDA